MKHNITGKHMRARNALLGKQQPLETRLPKASVKENETVHGQFVKAGQPANHLIGHNAVAHGHVQGIFLLSCQF